MSAVAGDPTWTRVGIMTVLLCALAGAVDSFDTQMIGFTGRLIAADLRFPVARLGWLFGVGQMGGVAGAILFGMLADRLGRARMLVISCAIAATFTALSMFAQRFETLLLCRLVTGFGLGGVMPCFLGLGVAAMPPRARIALTPVLYAVFPLGGVIGAAISAPIIGAHGWHGVFAIAAAALAAAALMALVLSVIKDEVAVRPLARPARPGLQSGQTGLLSGQTGVLSGLLSADRISVTLPLWGLFLLAPPGVYLFVLWMPPLLQVLGTTAAHTTILVGFANLGALALSLCGGWVMARVGPWRLIGPCLLVGGLGFLGMALTRQQFPALVATAVISGGALGGAMSLLITLAATAYPPELRATGIGWATAISRIGQMTAPVPIGFLVGGGFRPDIALALCGVPVLASLVPLLLLDKALRQRKLAV